MHRTLAWFGVLILTSCASTDRSAPATDSLALAPQPRPTLQQEELGSGRQIASDAQPAQELPKPKDVKDETVDAKSEEDSEKTVANREELEQTLREKVMRIETLKIQIEIAHRKRDRDLRTDEHEIERARKKAARKKQELDAFTESARQRLESSQIDLESSRSRVRNETEELEQLELMYAGSELEDRTSEIVLNRGRRALELAQRRLRLAEARALQLENVTLPMERAALEEAAAESEQSLERMQMNSPILRLEKDLSIIQLEHELQQAKVAAGKADEKLQKARDEAQK